MDWIAPSPAPGDGNPVEAWSGENPKSRAQHKTIQLDLVTWEHLRPDVEITSLDLVSTLQKAAPFLVAVRLEP